MFRLFPIPYRLSPTYTDPTRNDPTSTSDFPKPEFTWSDLPCPGLSLHQARLSSTHTDLTRPNPTCHSLTRRPCSCSRVGVAALHMKGTSRGIVHGPGGQCSNFLHYFRGAGWRGGWLAEKMDDWVGRWLDSRLGERLND